MLKTNDLQDFLYTSVADDIKVSITNLFLFVPDSITSVETQIMYFEATQNNYKVSYDDNYTERRVISAMIVQHDIGSTQQVNSPKYSISAHQTKHSTSAPDKKINFAIFDNVDLRKYHVEIDSLRYSRDSLFINYGENYYIDQYKKLKLFFKKYIGEPISNLFISYPDMETKHPIEIIDLRHHVDHMAAKKFQAFKEYGINPDNPRLFLILSRRGETELKSDGNKIFEVKVI